MPSADHLPLAARVKVETAAPHRLPVSRRLFGKFTEHLGRNVYGGAWAQILPNPAFASGEVWPDQNVLRRQLQAGAETHGLALAGSAAGVPPWWAIQDHLHARLDPPTHTWHLSAPAEAAGSLVSPIYLPVHRTSDYIVRLTGRGAGQLRVEMRLAESGQSLCSRTLALSGEWSTQEVPLHLRMTVEKGVPVHFALCLSAGGSLAVRLCLLFPADHMDGWDPDVVRYMRAAQLPLLRFPGGNFVSGYHWQDGVGPVAERPVRANPAWPVVEWNHVGTDEWLRLCELVGCDPFICVNAGDGTAAEAAAWVEYCNGAVTGRMGALRERNGHAAPYGVQLWEVGNELYGRWQVGYTDAAGYAQRYREYATRMLAADPAIHLIANGHTAEWNQKLVEAAGGLVKSLSHHALTGGFPADADAERVYLEHMAFTPAYARQWSELTQPLPAAGVSPHLAITEMQVFTGNPDLPNNGTLTEAIWTASIINAAIRANGLVELITHSALINHGGGLRKEREFVWAQLVWWVTHLYGTAPGPLHLLDTTVDSPVFSVEPYRMRTAAAAPFLDVVGLSDPSGARILFFLVNRHPHQPLAVHFDLPADMAQAEVALLTGESYMASNTAATPTAVQPQYEQRPWTDAPLIMPPCSVIRLALAP